MKNYFKEKFALTEHGATDAVRATIVSFFGYFVNLFPAILLMLFFDHLVLSNVKSNTFYYIISAAVILILYLVNNIEYHALYSSTFREAENLRVDIARKLRELPLSYFSKHDLSDLAQTVMADVSAIEHALSHSITKVMGFIVFFVIMCIMLMAGQFILGLATILPVFLYFFLVWISKKVQLKSQKKHYDRLRKNSESFQEAIELQNEIKALGMTEEIREKMNSEMEEGERLHIKSEALMGVILNLASISLYMGLVGVILIGSNLLFAGKISLLYFMGYLLAAMKLKDAAENISFGMMELFYIDAMIQRIKQIKKTEIQQGEDVELNSFDIEFKNVSFSYDEATPVLKNVSFTANQNQVTALVGKSGCGKTSVLRLISRLYDCDRGEVKISGRDIKSVSTKSLFDKISIVFQDVTLFNASIMENIRIGRLDASDEEVMRAAELANCTEFIEKLPEGYQTEIGENGARLSGGERQRLSIARAFLKDAPIIILDEIAASLDVENEEKIQNSLNKLTKGKTVVIISHRMKSIENVDKIVVLNEGEVEAAGRHDELLKSSVTYNTLVENAKLAEEFVY